MSECSVPRGTAFQFHKVQLKASAVGVYCYNKSLFQFHKVQLKVYEISGMKRSEMFQFHKVQLKAKVTFLFGSYTIVSIP